MLPTYWANIVPILKIYQRKGSFPYIGPTKDVEGDSTETVRPIYENNNSNHALSYKELHLGGLDGLEQFWGKWGPKNPQIFPRDRDFPC